MGHGSDRKGTPGSEIVSTSPSGAQPEVFPGAGRAGAAGAPWILDGGLATTLEDRGHDLDDPLWSARVLVDDPTAVRAVHREFLEAGADCIATASYQASVEGFAARGLDRARALELMERSVDLAVSARDDFWRDGEHPGRRRPLVAASIGPYGASLADGSEYTGAYGVGSELLYRFHRERWHLFAAGPADLLACETIPSGDEVRTLLRLLDETPDRAAWISLSCAGTTALVDGTPLSRVARWCEGRPNLVALGVNCVEPERVEGLLQELGRHTTKALIAYPNAGETYDAAGKRWSSPPSDLDWIEASARWVRAGARAVGGCCRVGPDRIRELRSALHRDAQ